MIRVWVVIACVAACDRKPPERLAACIADELPALHAEWKQLERCTASDEPCYDDCFAGDGDACMSRAIAVQPANDEEATKLFMKACRLGWALGCTNYGASLWVADRELSCARRLFEKACAADDSMGCGMVGRMMVQELDELVAGRKHLEASCARLQGPSCRILAFYLERGKFGAVPPRAKLDALMKQACDGGDPLACGEHATVDETFH